MFSQLGPLFKTTFRQAESNDTRQKIPHEERDNNGRKQNEEKNKETSSELWEDNTSVSIDALRAFLINFLSTMPEAQQSTNTQYIKNDDISKRPHESKRPTNTKNAKAVRAYQSMAAQSHTPSPPPKTQEKADRVEPTADLLESKELRDIYKLIDDLDILSQKNITALNIQKADTFVESLKNAVAKAL